MLMVVETAFHHFNGVFKDLLILCKISKLLKVFGMDRTVSYDWTLNEVVL